MKTKVSFIIPTLNEESRIGILIDNIKKLSAVNNYEIIVSDGHSTDKTREIAEKKGALVIRDNIDSAKNNCEWQKLGCKLSFRKYITSVRLRTVKNNVNY